MTITNKLSPSILQKLVCKYRVFLGGEQWSYHRRRGLWPRTRTITLKLENGKLCYRNRSRIIAISAQTLARDYEPVDLDKYLSRARKQNLLPMRTG